MTLNFTIVRKIISLVVGVLSCVIVFAQPEEMESVVIEDSSQLRKQYIDSILGLEPTFALSPEYFKERYNGGDLTYKVVDNKGNGFDSLYGARNLRPILYGVAYRGGANNYYHKENKRNNHNPLPPDGIRNLCQEGFSASVYLYRENWETATQADTCACANEGWNEMDYYQYDYYDEKHIYEMLKLVYQSAVNDSLGPVYLHCWNGWHASGLLSAITLRQFCGMSKYDAVNYWDINTDGANNSPRYQRIREMIKNFEPYDEFIITDELGNRICPPMPEVIDSSEIFVDVEHLVYVPESIPVGFDIVMHNVKFASGKTTFPNPSSNVDIQNLIMALNEQPDLKIEIGGYTDNSGSYAKNVQISGQRAKFVYDYLLKSGVDNSRISYKGYGPNKPLYSNRYKSTRAGNRRIEVKVIAKKVDNMNKLVDDENDAGISEKTADRKYKITNLIDSLAVIEVGKGVVLDSVQFSPNSIEIPESAKLDLDIVLKVLKENPGLKAEIAGHTDRSGLDELNQLLSKQRAEAVYNYLIANGAKTKQLSWKGYGSSKPITSNKYKWGRDLNRRIEFVILEK